MDQKAEGSKDASAAEPARLPKRRRWLGWFRYSLRTLLLGVLLIGGGMGLWWKWEPWVLAKTFHTAGIGSVSMWPSYGAISNSGRKLAVASEDGMLRLFEIRTGQMLWERTVDQRFREHHTTLRFIANDRAIENWSLEKDERLFFDAGDGIELTTPQQLHEFQEIPRQLKPESSPCIAAYSADGTRSLERVEFGPKFQGWRLDDAATGAIVAEIPCAHIGKWGMCFTRDSRRFALASYDQFVRIGDARDGKIEYFLRTGKRNMGVEFSRDGDLLAVCHDHDATVWSRRRPEYWWGVAWLPEFWLTVVFAVAFVWSVWRDRHELGRMAKTRA